MSVERPFVLSARFTQDERDHLHRLAAACDQSMNDYMRIVLLHAPQNLSVYGVYTSDRPERDGRRASALPPAAVTGNGTREGV